MSLSRPKGMYLILLDGGVESREWGLIIQKRGFPNEK